MLWALARRGVEFGSVERECRAYRESRRDALLRSHFGYQVTDYDLVEWRGANGRVSDYCARYRRCEAW
jgi:hypothetical protein